MFGNVDDAGDLDADYLDEVGYCCFHFLCFLSNLLSSFSFLFLCCVFST
jgi:hypothetical protein